MKIFMYLGLILFCMHLVSGKNPGLKTRITQAGLTYADQVAIDQLAKKVEGEKLPDQHGKSGKVTYDIKNIVIQRFNKPSSSITVTGNGLNWKADGLGLSIHGDFHYKLHAFIPVSDGGSIDVSVSGVSFSVGISIGVDGTGRPKMASNGCSCQIGDVSVHFHGGAAWIYNLFKGYVEKMIKSQLKGQLCKLIENAINDDGSKALAKLKVTVDIDKVFTLDYSFMDKPSFNPQHFMETYHKGEVFWTGSTTEAPFNPPSMPQIDSTSKMFYISVSDYVFNSMAYVAQTHGMLKYNLTDKDLPAKDRSFLNTTCEGSPCVGSLIPQVAKKYPNKQVALAMSSSFSPHMTTSNGKVSVQCGGMITMQTQKDGIFLLSLNASMQTSVKVSVENEKIYASIDDMRLKMHVVKSNVGQLNDEVLNFIANTAIISFVKPNLNKLGAQGIPLPVTGDIHFVNAVITLDKETLMIGTDLKYQ